jgi:type II secretory pathway component PulF
MYIFKEEEIALINLLKQLEICQMFLKKYQKNWKMMKRINQKIKKASTYPTVLLTFSVIAVVIPYFCNSYYRWYVS